MDELRTDDAITATFTPLGVERAADLAIERYGLQVTGIRRFDTERDDTFRVSVGEQRYVLKIANPADDLDVIAMQLAALQHVAAVDPGFPVPRVVLDRDGSASSWIDGADGEPRLVRVLSFLPGRTLDYDRTTPEQRRAVGAAIGRLSQALERFSHPGADRVLAWDLQRLATLRPHLAHIDDAEARADVEAELDRYATVTEPGLARVRHQVVHNDANMDNVVVDDEGWVSGILDFGDMVSTAVVADLAVAMAYAVPSVEALADPAVDPWRPAYDLADGYVSTRPLTADEIDLLPHLVRARMAQRMLVNSWLAATNPDNAHHTLRANGHAIAALRRLVAAEPPNPGQGES
ncbi:phosphotransferase [Longivirga aurantiaca]|uniref:Hydroxylysine kinase n=1 Tax=Longivirga aurantiaca TaxID=1837743 RepID=A0ABW1T5D9_9ACTN